MPHPARVSRASFSGSMSKENPLPRSLVPILSFAGKGFKDGRDARPVGFQSPRVVRNVRAFAPVVVGAGRTRGQLRGDAVAPRVRARGFGPSQGGQLVNRDRPGSQGNAHTENAHANSIAGGTGHRAAERRIWKALKPSSQIVGIRPYDANMTKTKGNKVKEMGLDDPLLGARLALPGVTRFVRISALSNLSLGVTFVSLSVFLLGVGFAEPMILVIGGLSAVISLLAFVALAIVALVLEPPTSLPGPRVGAQE